ncbi:hypothetical protein PHYPO_G00030510 [Pangasianodon hypophthalmus]|uniref:ZP domain-containing protein n=1 Tax=Pangasianodon hypophthalmus TaxID=310915 RepID=A0A5N5MJP3_PANHP|nr:hypothetical protein PHYPO_G00030510 [Pangasianodon hypophthalmus]
MDLPLLLCLQVALLFMSGVANAEDSTTSMFPVDSSAEKCTFPNSTSICLIPLQTPFMHDGDMQKTAYVSYNGFLAFDQPVDNNLNPSLEGYRNIIFPALYPIFSLNMRNVTFMQATDGPLVTLATKEINAMFPEYPSFVATWVLVVTWQDMSNPEYTDTVQVVLTSNGVEHTFILMNIQSFISFMALVGFAKNSFRNLGIIQWTPSYLLFTESNRWAYEVQKGPSELRRPVGTFPLRKPDVLNPGVNAIEVKLQKPFKYFGKYFDTIYVNENGALSFSVPLPDSLTPVVNADINIIAPLWTDLKADLPSIYYGETKDSILLDSVAFIFRYLFAELNFIPSWSFTATWNNISYINGTGRATFQAVLVSDNESTSLVVMSYISVDPINGPWLAGYQALDPIFSYKLPINDISELARSNTSLGWWIYRVDDELPALCEHLMCTENEVCERRESGIGCYSVNKTNPDTVALCEHLMCTENEVCESRELGIGCYCVNKTNPDNFDAIEACTDSSGSVSLSRCQLFEAGYSVEELHLKDPNCTGVVEDGRLVFRFDSDAKLCGGNLESNTTHLIYNNAVRTLSKLISHNSRLNISISCVYPLILNLSMPMALQAEGSVIDKEVPAVEGTYQSHMLVYPNNSFTEPYSGNVTIALNQKIYVAVKVAGFNSDHIATVLDSCWATPNMDSNSDICWYLIVKGCPNPDDGTVEVLENGISTSSYFYFRMFSFSALGDSIFLHCQVHLCLLDSGNCEMRCD